MNELGIYIHIPFCRTKCGYCDFYSLPGCTERTMDAYVEALEAHITEFFPTAGARTANSLYIGGGTPSVLGGKRLTRLVKLLTKRVNFVRGSEITLEVNPESVDKGLMRAVAAVGVNRVSMGVQSADNHQLYAIGRAHTFEKAREAVDIIRRHATENISLDMMYGLPEQDMASWQATVDAVLGLGPRHVSCYSLKLEPGTPMHAQRPLLPDDDLQADMYLWAVEALEAQGFGQYEISNFARPGFEARHNSKYWDLSEYVGFGCGAHSYYGGRRFAFVRDLDAYLAGVAGDGELLAEADEAPFFQRTGEYLMLGLRTTRGVEESQFIRRFGGDFEPYARALAAFVPSGHVARDGDRWQLTPKGFLVSNQIIGAVLEAGGC